MRLRLLCRAFALLVLLTAGQQGAVVHELAHLAGAHHSSLQAVAGETTDGNCALCPLFAQAATAALGHSFESPLLLRAAVHRMPAPVLEAVDAAVPTPRSRGPPSLG